MSFRLYVKCMPQDITVEEMDDLFGKYGKLREIWLSGTNPRFGFVVYRNTNAATKAMNEMNGRWLGGKYIRVSPALPRSSRFQMKKNRSKKLICYRCGQPGHYQYNCEIRNPSSTFDMDSQSSSSNRKREHWENTYEYKRFRRHNSPSKNNTRDKTKRRSSTEQRHNSLRNTYELRDRQYGRSNNKKLCSDQRR